MITRRRYYRRGNLGRGRRGTCGGIRRRDGSGRVIGNYFRRRK